MSYDAASPDGPEVPDLSDLDVVLRVEAGRIASTLGAIDALAPGALLPLPGPPGQVALTVHGSVIGTGRLVMIEDAPAVEVLTLAPSAESRAHRHGSPAVPARAATEPPGPAKAHNTL